MLLGFDEADEAQHEADEARLPEQSVTVAHDEALQRGKLNEIFPLTVFFQRR